MFLRLSSWSIDKDNTKPKVHINQSIEVWASTLYLFVHTVHVPAQVDVSILHSWNPGLWYFIVIYTGLIIIQGLKKRCNSTKKNRTVQGGP